MVALNLQTPRTTKVMTTVRPGIRPGNPATPPVEQVLTMNNGSLSDVSQQGGHSNSSSADADAIDVSHLLTDPHSFSLLVALIAKKEGKLHGEHTNLLHEMYKTVFHKTVAPSDAFGGANAGASVVGPGTMGGTGTSSTLSLATKVTALPINGGAMVSSILP